MLLFVIVGILGTWFVTLGRMATWEHPTADRWIFVGWGGIRVTPQPMRSFLELEYTGQWNYSGSTVKNRVFPLPGIAMDTVVVPFWLILLGVIPPWLFLERDACRVRRRQRRIGKGWCASCCYDLQGNESGNCPECGEAAVRLSLQETRA